jgi:transcriptional regulator of heat shock response
MREERARIDVMWRKLLALGADAVEEVLPAEHELWVEGAMSMLNKPEFASADAEAMRKVLSPSGLVAVIGPTRMEYSRVVPLVDYLGKALGRKIEKAQEKSS